VTAGQRSPIAGHEYAYEPGDSGWTLLLLHGTGGNEHDLLELGRQLAPGAALLSPRGRVLEGGTVTRFFARRSANDIDVPDLLVRTDELADFIDAATTTHGLDPARIIALGYSNGANIALSMLLRRPGVLAAAALLRPVLYHEPDPLPNLAGAAVLTSSGALDPYTPPDAIERLHDTLERAGADLEMHVDPEAGHSLVAEDLLQIAAWLTPRLA
jgi:phospholipase/carboxylesterase